MSPSVLRRYTPPTCTLEIAATGSVLSRWTDRTVLKNLRFQLNFDDPKLPPDQQVTITGDRLQLEALCEAVENYVQSLLNQAPGQLNVLLAGSNLVDSNSADSNTNQEADQEKATNQEKLPVAPPRRSNLALVEEQVPSARIYLKPKGLLSHDLHLGSLANGKPDTVVRLSALQLFDLANALDEYRAEALSLPSLAHPSWLKAPAGWAKVAAVLVLAIGATGAVTKFVLDISSPVSQVAESNQEEEVEVSIVPPVDRSTPLPFPSPGSSSSDLQLQPLFPPKPPAGTLQPVPVPAENADLPPTGVTEAPPTAPVANPAPASQSPAEAASSSSSQVVVLPTPESSSESSADGQTSPSLADTPPSLLADPSTVSPLGAGSSRLTSTSIPIESASTETAPIEAQSQAIGGEAPQVAANSSTAFDSFPQIAEVREYFVQQWQPPSELTQTLEYRLVLNADGTIQRIIPLGDASERFVDRTNMPLMGESFVSPLQDRQQLQVRLVLRPDGKVQTFADGN